MKKQITGVMIFLIGTFSLNADTIDPTLTLQTDIPYESLRAGFRSPPKEAKMRAFWIWNNGLATKQSITQDLEAMNKNGIAGVILADNGAPISLQGPVFMSNEWKELFAHAIREADRLGMEVSLNIQSGMGDPGNPNITPDNSFKRIVVSETPISGGKTIELKLAPPDSVLFYQDIAVQAVRRDKTVRKKDDLIKHWSYKSFNKPRGYDELFEVSDIQTPSPSLSPDEIVDVTAGFRNGTLRWNAPKGEWLILRYGMTSTGKRNDYATQGYRGGLCYDHIHKNGITAHWKEVAQPLIEIARQNGNSLKFVHTDSWEMGIINWTHDFEKEFEARRGYAITPFLPVLAGYTVGSNEITHRFLEDYRQTIGDMVIDNNYSVLRNLAHKNGVSLHSESAGPHITPVDGLRNYNTNDVAMGEFWPKSTTHRVGEKDRVCIKMGASATHIYEKRFFAAEGPTIVGPVWERAPAELKSALDEAFYTGVNRLCWHTYSSSPDEYGLPGVEYFAGVHLNRKVTWWKQSSAMIDYINRCQHLLSAGLPQADVLGHLGSGVPLYGFLNSDRKDLPSGYNWDMCNSEILEKRVEIRDGRILLPNGTGYALLALSEQEFLPLATLKKIEALVTDGMILVGNPPKRSRGLESVSSENEFNEIVQRMWQTAGSRTNPVRYGKGKLYWGVGVDDVLKSENIRPDFSWEPDEKIALGFAHRKTKDADIYFVANKWWRNDINDLDYHYLPQLPDRYITTRCSFRVDGCRTIERWDPMTGKITPVEVYRAADGCYTFPVSLGPEGSAFYLFRKTDRKESSVVSVQHQDSKAFDGNTPLECSSSQFFLSGNQLESFVGGLFTLRYNDGTQTTIRSKAPPKERWLDSPWEVTFNEPPSWGNSFTVPFKSLVSWTDRKERNVKYFSGTATYRQTIQLPPSTQQKGRVYIDLGNVQDIATLRINHRQVAIRWMAPFRAEITDFVKEGTNTIEIDITNLWVNRLIGDEQLPKEEKKSTTTLESDARYQRLKEPDADKLLRKSGLLGPVVIRFSRLTPIPGHRIH